MKTIFKTVMLSIFSMLFILPSLYSQCSGTVTLSTQSQVNAFTCTSFNGTLIIEDNNDGVDNIVDLNPIYDNGMKAVTSIVTGDLIIRNCNSLSNLQGIDGIQEIQGSYIVENNPSIINMGFTASTTSITGSVKVLNNNMLVTLTIFSALESIGGALEIKDNPQLVQINLFNSLESVGGIMEISNNNSLVFLIDFESLNSAGQIIIENNASLASFGDFASLTTSGNIIIRDNESLVTHGAFNNLTNVTNGILWFINNESLSIIGGFSNLTSIGGSLFISQNPALTSITSFEQLGTAGVIDIRDNSALIEVPTFNAVTSLSTNLLMYNNISLVNFPTFNSLTNIGNRLDIRNSASTSLSGFSSLSTVGENLIINNFSSLTEVTAFSNLNSVGSLFELANNSLLSDCCWALPIINSAQSVGIFGNATGCENQAAIGGEAPMIECEPDVTIFVGDEGFCAAEIPLADPIPTDDCDAIVSYTYLLELSDGTSTFGNADPGTVFPYAFELGIQTLTFTVEDEQGNTSSCQTVITVLDNIFPEITCSPDQTLNVDEGSCVTEVSTVYPTPSDNCTITTYEVTLVDGNGTTILNEAATPGSTDTRELPAGINTYTFIATDESGNSSICETIITVVDNILPSITCSPHITVSVDPGMCSAAVTSTDPTPTDNCGILTYTLDLIDANGIVIYDGVTATDGFMETLILPVGDNIYTYTVTDVGGQTLSCNTIVTVEDDEAPTWTDTDNTITITGECGIDDPLALFNANMGTPVDNCINVSATLTDTQVNSICGGAEEHVYTMIATDAAGNESLPYTIIVNLEDTEPPVLSPLPANANITCNDPIPATPTITASDQCAGDISGDIVITESSTFGNCETGTVQEIRTYTYSVEDGCGNMTSSTWELIITNDFVVDLGDDIAVCDQSSTTLNAGPGTSFLWSTGETTQIIAVTTSGTYSVDVISTNGCCEADEISVLFDTAPNATAIGAQLDCSGNAVQIFGNSSTSNVTYSWSGPGGYMSSEQNPFVTAAGTYTLSVTNASGCIATATAEVTANTDVPDVTATGGTLTCTQVTTQLTSSSTEPGVTYMWSGPNGYSSDEQNPVVSEAGTYEVTVTAPNSCVASTTVEVMEDIIAPSATATAGVLTCVETSTQIMTSASGNVTDFSWTGPGGFASDLEDPTVSDVGSYTLVLTAGNGCTATITVEVTGDFAAPNASATGGILNCSASQVLISGNSTTENVTYSWTGPNGFTSNLQNPQVSDVGTYTLTVMSQNGCTTSVTALVEADEDLPNVSATGGAFDCVVSTIQLMGSSTTAGVTFKWTGPNGFISSEPNPFVSEAGIYTLTVLAENGCSASTNAEVILDADIPNISAAGGTIDCTNSTVQLSGSSTTSGVSFSWTGPDGFTSNDANPLVDKPGSYTLSVLAENGCLATTSVEVIADVESPQISAMGGTIDCNNTTVQLTGSSTTSGVSFSWTGPDGFTSNAANPLVDKPGSYTLTVAAENGCIDTQTVTVDEDKQEAEITFDLGDVECVAGVINLTAIANMNDLSVTWTGPDGFTSSSLEIMISDAGTYILTVIPENGCSSTFMYELENDVVYSQTITTVDITETNTMGSATIDIVGGTGPFIIEWDNGEMGETATNLTAGDHTVDVIDGLGCTRTFDFFIDEIVSTYKNGWIDNISLYPNPASNTVHIDLPEQVKFTSIRMYDLSGKMMKEISFDISKDVVSVDVGQWSSGIYLAKITAEQSSHVLRFIVE